MSNKRKWEIEYETLKNKDADSEIKKLNAKIKRLQNKEIEGTNPQEYRTNKLDKERQINDTKKKMENLSKIKENSPQVERILKFRDAQQKRLEKLNTEKKTYEADLKETKKLSEISEKLENELAELKEMEEKINNALKNKKLSDVDRKKLEQAKIQNRQKQSQNHNDFSDNQKRLSLKLDNPLPKREFNKEIQTAKNMISKCNFIGRNLMEGKKMEDISVDLRNWKDSRFTDKSNEIKNKIENTKSEEKNVENVNENHEEIKTEKNTVENSENNSRDGIETQVLTHENNTNELTTTSDFDKKYPRIAKIRDFFKNAYESVKNKISNMRKGKQEVSEESINQPEVKEEKHDDNKTVDKTIVNKQTAEQMANRKAEFYKRLAETGKLSQTPKESKFAESMKQIDQTKKEIDNEER